MKATKLLVTAVALLLFTGNTFAQQALYSNPKSERAVKTINTQWTFNYFPEEKAEKGGYENPAFDDSQWSAIAVPHTWQTYETTHELHPYIRNVAAGDNPYWWNGWGWYRKRIIIGKEHEGKKVSFEFDGVQKYSKVYLNGKLLGDHKGGFNSFYMDGTDAVKFGEENILVVAVNNTLTDKYRIPPMNAGNWAVYGGITRDVRIVVTDRLNVPYQGSYKHEGGTFITTPKVSEKEAGINIKSYVQNLTSESKEVRIVTVLADADNKVLEKLEAKKTIKAGEIAEYVQDVLLKKPKLWSPTTPYIYNAYTEVYEGKRLADVYHSTFGVRSIEWDYNAHRLILNGKLTHLHGINRHEEYIWLGQAFPKWIAERDMMDIAKGLEVNYMRTAHYPNDPQVYYFMDKSGICINEELPNIKNQDFDPVVQEQNCREMIRRDRNHPAIIVWSMGNETDHACDSRIAWEEDKTRIITVRQPYNDSYNPEFCKHTDKEMPVESYLRCTIRGWYDKDDKNLEPQDGQWAGTDVWQYMKSIGADEVDEQSGSSKKQKVKDKKLISEHNGTVWLYADHGADREYVNAPLKHINPKGWVDSWRNPKYVYYLWQANFAQKPMVHIQPHFWRKQYVGKTRDFYVDSNCDEVELFVNGKSKGKQKPTAADNYSLKFKNILVEEGTIEVVGAKKDGARVSDKVVMAGDPAALTIKATKPTMMASLDNIIEVKVDIVDKNGVHVYGANNTLKFQVEGPATLIGPDVYTSDRDKAEEYEGTMYIDAPVTNLIRSAGVVGKVTVTVSATGLKSASTAIDVLPYADNGAVQGIEEPKLKLESRKPVQINTTQANHLKAPEEMKHYAGEVSFPKSQQGRYAELSKEFILKENPTLDSKTVDFKYVIDAFVSILNSTTKFTGERGYVVADDYNFIADQYNVSRAITKNITSKKLPAAYKEFLIDYYAKSIVSQGIDKNYIAENQLIDKLPQGGGVVVFTGGEFADKSVKPIVETNVIKLVEEIYPEAKDWKSDEQKKAYMLITRINPTVTYKSVRDKKTKERTNTYTAQPNSIVYIPELSVLKKYSFPDREI